MMIISPVHLYHPDMSTLNLNSMLHFWACKGDLAKIVLAVFLIDALKYITQRTIAYAFEEYVVHVFSHNNRDGKITITKQLNLQLFVPSRSNPLPPNAHHCWKPSRTMRKFDSEYSILAWLGAVMMLVPSFAEITIESLTLFTQTLNMVYLFQSCRSHYPAMLSSFIKTVFTSWIQEEKVERSVWLWGDPCSRRWLTLWSYY